MNNEQKRLRMFLQGFQRAWLEKHPRNEIAAMYVHLAFDLCREALGSELTKAAWLELMDKTYDKLTRH